MKLPTVDSSTIEREKIVDYLLNPAHRYGASKARYLTSFGFRVEHWQTLADALREHARQHEVRRVRDTGFGPRYEIEGALLAPDGREPRMRAVWQMDEGQLAPRLITADPLSP